MSCWRWACPNHSRVAAFALASAGTAPKTISTRRLRRSNGCSRAKRGWPREGAMAAVKETAKTVADLGERYKYGFVTDIEMERAPKGLSEDTVRFISAKKGEPDWLLEWRLSA